MAVYQAAIPEGTFWIIKFCLVPGQNSALIVPPITIHEEAS
jgi:hypothetical protein